MNTTKDKSKEDKKIKNKDGKADSPLQPDPETLHTTDPQEHMEGPVSSVVQNVKEKMEEEGGEAGDKK
jgi:hypothetical protein